MKKRLISLFVVLLIVLNGSLSHGEGLKLSGESYVLIDTASGRIIMEKNSNKKMPMASTTKIMTALIAIEEGKLEDKVVIDNKSVGIEGSSIYLKEGEVITLQDLLYGLMLRSGNDSSIAIANHIGKDEQDFVRKMNDKASSIGAVNTNFTNPHGLDDKDHYSTAYDLAIITKEALKHKEFNEISKTKTYKANRETNNYFINKNKTLWEYDGGNGGKTGYTMTSGRCLVSISQREGMNLIAVSLNARDWFNDNYKMMDYGFENFKSYTIYDKNQLLKKIEIKDGRKEVYAIAKSDFIYPLSDKEKKEVKIKLDINKDLSLPVNKKQKIGTIETYLEGVLIKQTDLIAKEDVKKNNIIQRFIDNKIK